MHLIDIQNYEACRVAGVVRRLRLDPVEGCLEVTIVDETGSLVARWPLRRSMDQLRFLPGRSLILEGMPRPADNDQLVMEEPSYETVPFRLAG